MLVEGQVPFCAIAVGRTVRCGSMFKVKPVAVLFPLRSEFPALMEYRVPATLVRPRKPAGNRDAVAFAERNHSKDPSNSAEFILVVLGITISPVKMPFPVE